VEGYERYKKKSGSAECCVRITRVRSTNVEILQMLVPRADNEVNPLQGSSYSSFTFHCAIMGYAKRKPAYAALETTEVSNLQALT